MPTIGAGWCPPGRPGPGIGGMVAIAAVLVSEALIDAINMHSLHLNCARACQSVRGDRDLESG